MKISWIRYALVFFLAFSSGAALMVISHGVQHAQRQIASAEKAISHEREAIRVLAAEWSYLNNPERLEVLASTYLNLEVAMPEQLVSNVGSAQEVLIEEDVVTVAPEAKVYDVAFKPSDVVSVVSSAKPRMKKPEGSKP